MPEPVTTRRRPFAGRGWTAGLAFALALWLPTLASATQPGERIWLPIDSADLRRDGYVIGVVESLDVPRNRAVLSASEVQMGDEEAFYGTCQPQGGASQVFTADAMASSEPVRLEVPLDRLLPWREGKDRNIDRMNLGTVYYQWLEDGFGINTDRCRRAERTAAALSLPVLAESMAWACAEVEARGPDGFPRPPDTFAAELPALWRALSSALQPRAEWWPHAVQLGSSAAPLRADPADASGLPRLALARLWRQAVADAEALQRESRFTPEHARALAALITLDGMLQVGGRNAETWVGLWQQQSVRQTLRGLGVSWMLESDAQMSAAPSDQPSV